MAFELSRVDRLTKTYDLAARFPDLDGPFTAAEVALLPPRSGPNAATAWSSVSVASGIASVLFAGPDADSTGAVVVPASADLWLKVTDAPETDAKKIERITVLGGGALLAVPANAVVYGTGAGGALSGSYPNPGLNEVALGNAIEGLGYGRAAPVLSNFSYEPVTGNLLSYQEDGITITLTYNTDGTVATSQRGSDPVQTYTYTGDNLTGVA